MEVTYSFDLNKKTELGLQNISDDFLFAVADQVLEFSISKEIIPINTHKMETKSRAYGVHRNKGDMVIGSPTDYATRVWNLPQETTHWTNQGKAHSQWYAYTIKQYGQVIIDNALNRAWKENM